MIGRQRLPKNQSRSSDVAHGVIPANGPVREAPRDQAWASRPALSNHQRCCVWDIENQLHWVTDMVFRDDECRVRTDHAAANFTTIKHMALNLLRRPPGKQSLRGRRKAASWDDDFLASLVTP
jgi:hypothetical protein